MIKEAIASIYDSVTDGRECTSALVVHSYKLSVLSAEKERGIGMQIMFYGRLNARSSNSDKAGQGE